MLFTSLPSVSATARRSRAKCVRRSSSAASSPNRSRSSVDPTTSVKSTVTTPADVLIASESAARSGRAVARRADGGRGRRRDAGRRRGPRRAGASTTAGRRWRGRRASRAGGGRPGPRGEVRRFGESRRRRLPGSQRAHPSPLKQAAVTPDAPLRHGYSSSAQRMRPIPTRWQGAARVPSRRWPRRAARLAAAPSRRHAGGPVPRG